MRNAECGMRKEKKRTEVFEFGIGNAECGKLEKAHTIRNPKSQFPNQEPLSSVICLPSSVLWFMSLSPSVIGIWISVELICGA
jgi:hypothetical protein